MAVLEGDDCWTSPHKLQRQADLLDANPDYALCFHSVHVVWEGAREKTTIFRPREVKTTYTLRDLLEYNFIASCSAMYRRAAFAGFPPWFSVLPYGDWVFHVLHAQHGPIGYLDEVMGNYRQHDGGIYSTKTRAQKMRVAIEMLRRFLCVLPKEYRGVLKTSLCRHYCTLARQYCDDGELGQARGCVRECLREARPGINRSLADLFRVMLRVSLPGSHRYYRMLRSPQPNP